MISEHVILGKEQGNGRVLEQENEKDLCLSIFTLELLKIIIPEKVASYMNTKCTKTLV